MSKKNKFEYIILTLVFIFGFLVRLYKINNPIADWHSWRQADTASVSKVFVQNGINLLLPKYHDISSIQTGKFNPEGYRMVEFPIYNAIHALLFTNVGKLSLEVWGRLLTVIIGLINAWFLYLIGKRLISRWGGVLASFFYLFIPYNIYFTRVILPDPIGVMFGLVSVWAFLEFYYSSKNTYLFTSAIFFALMMLIKPYLGFYVFPIIYLSIKKYGIKKIISDKSVLFKVLIYLIVALLPFILWRAWEGKFAEGIPFYKWAFNGNLIRFRPTFWYWIFGERLSHLILGGLGVIPFSFGVLNTKTKNHFIHFFLLGALFYVILVADANVMHDYYQILTIPVISLTLSSGALYLWNQEIFARTFSRIVLIFSVFVMLITGYYLIKGNYQINRPEIIAAGMEIDKITPKDALIVAPYNGDTAFLYQTNRWGWPAVDNSIDNIIKEGATYFVSVDLADTDTINFEKRFPVVEKTNKFVILKLK